MINANTLIRGLIASAVGAIVTGCGLLLVVGFIEPKLNGTLQGPFGSDLDYVTTSALAYSVALRLASILPGFIAVGLIYGLAKNARASRSLSLALANPMSIAGGVILKTLAAHQLGVSEFSGHRVYAVLTLISPLVIVPAVIVASGFGLALNRPGSARAS